MSLSSDLNLLTRLRTEGELTSAEYEAAKAYVIEHGSLQDVPDKTVAVVQNRSSASTLKTLLPKPPFQYLTDDQQKLLIFAMSAIAVIFFATVALHFFTISPPKFTNNLGNPLGAIGWTVILVGINGFLVGYNLRIMTVIAVPLFLLLLLSPLWKEDQTSRSSGTQSATIFSRQVTASEYGREWPFPTYNYATLRCEQTTRNGVTRPLVTVDVGGNIYGLNGAAMGWGGYGDARRIMAKHPQWQTYQLGATTEMIREALAGC